MITNNIFEEMENKKEFLNARPIKEIVYGDKILYNVSSNMEPLPCVESKYTHYLVRTGGTDNYNQELIDALEDIFTICRNSNMETDKVYRLKYGGTRQYEGETRFILKTTAPYSFENIQLCNIQIKKVDIMIVENEEYSSWCHKSFKASLHILKLTDVNNKTEVFTIIESLSGLHDNRDIHYISNKLQLCYIGIGALALLQIHLKDNLYRSKLTKKALVEIACFLGFSREEAIQLWENYKQEKNTKIKQI